VVKNILGTIGTRVLTALLAFLTWTLLANLLGPEKVGTISLIVFSVTIIQLFTNFVAGAPLVYLAPRAGIYRLFVPAMLWTLVITLGASFMLEGIGILFPAAALIPDGYLLQVLFLALVMSLASVNAMLLLGLEKVKAFNLISLLQSLSLFMVLGLFIFVFREAKIDSWYLSILVSQLLALILGILFLLPHLRREPLTGMKSLMGDILRFGTFVQFANLFQTLNYRLSLKLTDHFLGRSAVGILSLGMQLAEGLWIISRSIATVQLSRLSNEEDREYGIRMTLSLAKIAFVVTALAMTILVAIPAGVFAALFSAKFFAVKTVILSLAPGIVLLSISMIFSGYFSGTNRPVHNMIGSASGLVFTILLGVWLIPRYGLAGAGWAASASYAAVTLYQFIVFIRITQVKPVDFLLTFSEIKRFFQELKAMKLR